MWFSFRKVQTSTEKSYKTKFCPSWKEDVYKQTDSSEELFSWVQPVFGDPFRVKCDICIILKPFLIGNGGITQVKQHADSATHTQSRKTYSNQTSFLQPDLSTPLQMTAKDGLLKAEVIQVLKMVELNMPFVSANDSGKSFPIQFPDSNIVPRLQNGGDKGQILHPIWDMSVFTFYVSGRYEEHAIHVSFRRNNNFTDQKAVRRLRKLLLKTGEKSSYPIHRVSICGSLQRWWYLHDHFFKFMENFKVNRAFLVSIAMDGPNVSKSFKRKSVKKLEKDKGNSFLSWLMWITYCEQWFRERFETIEGNTGRRTIFHWLIFLLQILISEKGRLQRDGKFNRRYCWIFTQVLFNSLAVHWQSFCANGGAKGKHQGVLLYFFLPAQKGFMKKNGATVTGVTVMELGNTERYQRLKKALKMTCCYHHYHLYTSNIFKNRLCDYFRVSSLWSTYCIFGWKN